MDASKVDVSQSVRRSVGCLWVDSIAVERSVAFLIKLTGGDDEMRKMLADAQAIARWATEQRTVLELRAEEYPSRHGDPIVWAKDGLRAKLARRIGGGV